MRWPQSQGCYNSRPQLKPPLTCSLYRCWLTCVYFQCLQISSNFTLVFAFRLVSLSNSQPWKMLSGWVNAIKQRSIGLWAMWAGSCWPCGQLDEDQQWCGELWCLWLPPVPANFKFPTSGINCATMAERSSSRYNGSSWLSIPNERMVDPSLALNECGGSMAVTKEWK